MKQSNFFKTCLFATLGLAVAVVFSSCDREVEVTDISLAESEFYMWVGANKLFVLNIVPENATDRNATWTSSDESIVTINNNGRARALAVGEVQVTAQIANHTATASVVVRPMPEDLEDGVLVGNTIWATRNVGMPGYFVENPRDRGMFYQWNRNTGWHASLTDTLISSEGGGFATWDSSAAPGTTWYSENDPCPPGWRVPTREELVELRGIGSVWTDSPGSGRVFGHGENSVFLPAAGWIRADGSALFDVGFRGFYWSSSTTADSLAFILDFIGGRVYPSIQAPRAMGFSVRCVYNY